MKVLIQEVFYLDISIVFAMINVNCLMYISGSHLITYVHQSSFVKASFFAGLKTFFR